MESRALENWAIAQEKVSAEVKLAIIEDKLKNIKKIKDMLQEIKKKKLSEGGECLGNNDEERKEERYLHSSRSHEEEEKKC
ncbi:hypothetical protein DEO72_LG5g3314 [Vigna unguiculata]|uniref:Uncharacterized protein n=1 Tax=Vigna unguiculata TaxID=3917 RepID=A0A4D6M3Z0_VIGUN|nr:hypothetical protein DEO72_LG5g3314 [Vigna unguiculata]